VGLLGSFTGNLPLATLLAAPLLRPGCSVLYRLGKSVPLCRNSWRDKAPGRHMINRRAHLPPRASSFVDTSECSKDLHLLRFAISSIFPIEQLPGRARTHNPFRTSTLCFLSRSPSEVEMNKRTNSFAIVQVIPAVPFVFVASCPVIGQHVGQGWPIASSGHSSGPLPAQ
jgi:hypothetical protein